MITKRPPKPTSERFPRLLKLVQWVAVLSPGEARTCIESYRLSDPYSSEAVAQFGGPTAVVRRAVQLREYLRDHWATHAQYKTRIMLEQGVSGNFVLRAKSEPYGQELTVHFTSPVAMARYLMQYLHSRQPDSVYINTEYVRD